MDAGKGGFWREKVICAKVLIDRNVPVGAAEGCDLLIHVS